MTALDSIIYRIATQAEEKVESPPFVDSPLSSTSLVSLIGQEVTSGKVEPPGALVLGLEGGLMRFVDHSEMYESFIITIGDTEIIV